MKKGILFGIAAYALWGVFPIYWKFLHDVPAVQIICHRIIWSFVLLMIVILSGRKWRIFYNTVRTSGKARFYFIAGVLLAVNWLIYVWSINTEQIVETSLGYFINPLLNVLLGVVFLRERLRSVQWAAVGLAAAGMIYLAVHYGRMPWIALSLAATFGIYGLLKKKAGLESLYGLTLEMGIVFPFALVYLAFAGYKESGAFISAGIINSVLLAGAGIISSVPLLMFASATRRIPLTMIGLLQYIAPTSQFLIGVFVYREPFGRSDLIGFVFVWIALIVFWAENCYSYRMKGRAVSEEA